MRNKKYIIGVLLFLSLAKIDAQNATPIHDRNPEFPKIETPNAASFSKFIDNPISLYSGTPDVSITLFNLKDGAINIPISLRYNTSGIKVNEEAGWVGLGWNLNVGGVITKNSVGKADEVDNGSDYRAFLQYLSLCGRSVVDTYCAPMYTELIHRYMYEKLRFLSYNTMGQLNPDVYYYSYPGGGGKFIIDHRDNKIYLLDRENGIKVYGENFTGYNINYGGFYIITEDGVEHAFGRRSSISDVLQPFGTTSINYTLDYSIYPNGQRVDYTYTTIPYKKVQTSESYQRTTSNNFFVFNNSTVNLSGLSSYPTDINSSTLEGTEFILTGIKTTNYQIKFVTSARTDIEGGMKLDKISLEPIVKNTDSEIKQLVFKYDYFIGKKVGGPNLTNSQYTLNRLKLNSINYLDKTNTKTDNRYDFYYDGETLPQKTSYAVDYWGYYNGQVNSYLLPNMEYLYYGLKSIDTYKDIVGMSKKMVTNKANRASEEKYTKAGILKGIKYPTGGYREFEYELNTFVDYFIPTVSDIEDLTYKDNISDRNNSADKKSCSFTLEESTEISLDMTVARGLNSWYDVTYHSLKIYKVNGTTKVLTATTDCSAQCYSNHINSVSTGIVDEASTISLSAGQYIAEVDLPDALGDQTDFNSKHGEFRAIISFFKPAKTNESKGCGLRIKNITSYNDINKTEKLLSTDYIYVKDGTTVSSGVLHEKPQFHQLETCFYTVQHGDGLPIGGVPKKWTLPVEQWVMSSNNYTSNPYGSIPSVGYSCVKEVQKGGNSQGYTIHNFINKEPMTTQNSVRLDDPLNGRLADLRVYNKNNTLIKQEKYTYRSATYHNYYGINVTFSLNMYPKLFKSPYSIANYDPGYLENLFRIKAHALNSVDIYLDKKESIVDGITSTETYKYNDTTHQLKERTTTLSDGSSLKRTYSYINESVGYDDRMTGKNMLSSIVEEKIFSNQGYIGGAFTTYSNLRVKARYFSEVNGRSSNVVTYDKNGINTEVYPLENVTYKEYDFYNNPVYIVHNGSSDLVYLWSYKGQYPIAEIKNATYSQALAAVKDVFGVGNIYDLSELDNPSPEKIELLRTNSNLTNALVTTFTYTPLVGIRTATNAKGITTFYDYDSFGRLKEAYIKENGLKRIIDSYEYNLSNK